MFWCFVLKYPSKCFARYFFFFLQACPMNIACYIACFTNSSRKLGSMLVGHERSFMHKKHQQKQNRLRFTLVKANTPPNWHLGVLAHMHFLKAFLSVQKGGYLFVHQESHIIDFWQLPPSVFPRNPTVFLDTRTYYWSCEEFLIVNHSELACIYTYNT